MVYPPRWRGVVVDVPIIQNRRNPGRITAVTSSGTKCSNFLAIALFREKLFVRNS
jgi:hypothetical protein